MDECDFCSNQKVVRRYQCMDFDAESKAAGVIYYGTRDTPGPTNLVLASQNYWAACADCAGFVDAEDIEGLMRHVTRTLVDADEALDPIRRIQVIAHMRHTYKLFFRYRIRVAEE
jgi:hypothetical protein